MRRVRAGFSLIELLLVLSVMAILSALLLPSAAPAVREQLYAAAEVLAGDVAYARTLAVTNGSSYRLAFDCSQSRYVLEHSGTDATLDVLPSTPFRAADDPATQQIVELSELPQLSRSGVRLAAVGTMGTLPQPATELEFGPLGATIEADATVIWLTAGAGDAQRFLKIRVDPITGLTWVGSFQSSGPPDAIVVTSPPAPPPLPPGP